MDAFSVGSTGSVAATDRGVHGTRLQRAGQSSESHGATSVEGASACK